MRNHFFFESDEWSVDFKKRDLGIFEFVKLIFKQSNLCLIQNY